MTAGATCQRLAHLKNIENTFEVRRSGLHRPTKPWRLEREAASVRASSMDSISYFERRRLKNEGSENADKT